MSDLLPCPFCGGNETARTFIVDCKSELREHSIFCQGCGGAINSMVEGELETRWNTRHNPLLSRLGQPAVDALMAGDDNVGVYRITECGIKRLDKPAKQGE